MSRFARASILLGTFALALACGGGSDELVTSPPPMPPVGAPPAAGIAAPAPAAPVAPTGPHASTIAAWPEATGPAGGFMIRMPGVPEDDASPMDTPLGTATTHTWGSTHEGTPMGYFMVSTTDYPAGFVGILGVDQAMDSAREGLVIGSGGTLVDEKKVIVGGHPARRFHVKAVTEGIPLEMVGRMLIVNDRIYIVAVSTIDTTANDWADGWLDTFRLL